MEEYPDRPVIKVEGEMGGAFWLGNIGVYDDVRHVHGTIETIADGSVRWSLVRLLYLLFATPCTDARVCPVLVAV